MGEAQNQALHPRFVRLPRHLEQLAFGDDSFFDGQRLYGVRDGVQAERLGDRRTGFSDFMPNLVVGEREAVRQRLQAVRFLEGRQVLALQVLDERNFERFRVIRVLFDARDFAQPRSARRMVAALAGNDQVFLGFGEIAHQ